MTVNSELVKKLELLGPRKAFGYAFESVSKERKDTVLMAADVLNCVATDAFEKAYPERVIDTGIAEQNMIGIAAGLALSGKQVYATTFAPFLTMRAYEQIRTDVAYMKADVKLIGMDTGCAFGVLGYTHYGMEDIAIMRAIPNMTVISPCDGLELYKAVHAASRLNGPVYIRLTGDKKTFKPVYEEDFDYEIGKSITLKDGSDAVIIATGTMVREAMDASIQLKNEGIEVAVVDMHTIKPIDEDAIAYWAHKVPLMITLEEHNRVGGLGGAVSEVVAGIKGVSAQVVRLGMPDKFGIIADHDRMLDDFGLNAQKVSNAVLQLLKNA